MLFDKILDRECVNAMSHDIQKQFSVFAEKWRLKKVTLPVEMVDGGGSLFFQWLNALLLDRHQRKQLLLPDFGETESVFIFSDYGGEAKSSRYLTYTFTIVAYDTVGAFAKAMEEIRKKHFSAVPYKEISFKDLKYGPIKRGLEEYLTVSNNFLNGLVFTLIVDKNIDSLLAPHDKEATKLVASTFEEHGFGKWKPAVAEKLYRILQPISFFCKMLIADGKKIMWMTDADSIMANDQKATEATQLLGNAIRWCKTPNAYQVVGVVPKPFDEKEGLFLRDLLSLSDLIAGSLEHYYTNDKNVVHGEEESVARMLQWLSGQGVGLKKLTMRMDLGEAGIVGSLIDFKAGDPLLNIDYVDFAYDTCVAPEAP